MGFGTDSDIVEIAVQTTAGMGYIVAFEDSVVQIGQTVPTDHTARRDWSGTDLGIEDIPQIEDIHQMFPSENKFTRIDSMQCNM